MLKSTLYISRVGGIQQRCFSTSAAKFAARRSRFAAPKVEVKDEQEVEEKPTIQEQPQIIVPKLEKKNNSGTFNLDLSVFVKNPLSEAPKEIKNDLSKDVKKTESKKENNDKSNSKNVPKLKKKNDKKLDVKSDVKVSSEKQPKKVESTKKPESEQKETDAQIKIIKKEEKKILQPIKPKVLKKKAVKQNNEEKAKFKLDIPTFLSVSNFATILRVRVPELLIKLEELGFENMTNDYILDAETAELIAEEYGFEVNRDDNLGADLFPQALSEDPKKLKPRSPIVTIMGHVDHGKTTILDYLRKSSIVKGEFGGITQHIGAFVVTTPVSKKKITFLDTPGHAAFLKMRERGANMTDIVILVVAADDSVMPQTIEAIKHAKNAGVPVVVAINKCDKETANPDKVVADLSGKGIDVEDYGGDTPCIRVSGKTGLGMKDLEETVIAVAELLDLKTQERGIQTEGWVLESQVKKGLGNVATFLVKQGELKTGQFIVAGTTFCKIRGMKDEHGKNIKVAKPAQPVEISGWKDLPDAGEVGLESKNEALAKKVIANREKRKRMLDEAEQIDIMNKQRTKALVDAQRDEKIQDYQLKGFSLEEIKELEPELFDDIENQTQKVNFIIKADVSGSAEAVRQSIEGLGNDEVQSNIIFEEVGSPTDSDINRAKDSNAQILAFNVKVPKDIMNTASQAGVEIKEYNVIYHLIENVLDTLTSKLPPIYETKVTSKVSIKQLFDITIKGKKTMTIAGSRVVDGIFKRNSDVRLVRKNDVIYEGKVKQLKVEKDDVAEVQNGADCGIALDGGPDIQVGDIIESVEKVAIKRHL